jgi:N-acetylglutamate synthase-like GNAT family acetyltransferase
MIEIREISMNDPLYQRERELRNEVLLRPIGIEDFGWEHKDTESTHIIAVEKPQDGGKETLIGCVLLHPLIEEKKGQLMQMAVRSNKQKGGIGRLLVARLLEIAKSKGITTVFCHSRSNVYGFYGSVGFKKIGNEFEEVGIKHHKMSIEV